MVETRSLVAEYEQRIHTIQKSHQEQLAELEKQNLKRNIANLQRGILIGGLASAAGVAFVIMLIAGVTIW